MPVRPSSTPHCCGVVLGQRAARVGGASTHPLSCHTATRTPLRVTPRHRPRLILWCAVRHMRPAGIHAAVDGHDRTADVVSTFGTEKEDSLGNLIGLTTAASGD